MRLSLSEADALVISLSTFSQATTTGDVKLEETRLETLPERFHISKGLFISMHHEESANLDKKRLMNFQNVRF
jgi:hypothetical protein